MTACGRMWNGRFNGRFRVSNGDKQTSSLQIVDARKQPEADLVRNLCHRHRKHVIVMLPTTAGVLTGGSGRSTMRFMREGICAFASEGGGHSQ
jgi:hypothetical protein